jgi:hypothetical protein
MHDLMVLDPALPGAVTPAEMARVADYLSNEIAESTR